MRFVVVNRLGTRGEGLGNEAIGWCKGFLAAQQLRARLVGPGWGLNPRRYYRHFQTSRLDFVFPEILKRLPHHAFTESDYWGTNQVAFEDAVSAWATAKGLTDQSSFVVTVGGMYGGYPAIRNARSFFWNQLLNSRDCLANIFACTASENPRKLSVAVHMRRGDFSTLPEGDSARGKFNIRVPGSWYLQACQKLQDAFGNRVAFHFFTDHGGPEFKAMVERFNPRQIVAEGLTECSDLALMSMSDLRICSISSYSLTACYLSDGPYLWYEPQLISHADSYSLWGKDKAQNETAAFKAAHAEMNAVPQDRLASMITGWPWAGEEGLPPGLLAQLEERLATKGSAANLLSYGVVPHRALTTQDA